MKVIAVAILCVLVATIVANSVPFQDCGSSWGTIKTVNVSGCSVEPCILKKNTTVNVTIDFTAKNDISVATTKVYGIIDKVKIPFPLNDSNACDDMTCPISKGSDVTYKNGIFVNPLYPKVNVIVEWELVSGSNTIICFTLPAKVSD